MDRQRGQWRRLPRFRAVPVALRDNLRGDAENGDCLSHRRQQHDAAGGCDDGPEAGDRFPVQSGRGSARARTSAFDPFRTLANWVAVLGVETPHFVGRRRMSRLSCIPFRQPDDVFVVRLPLSTTWACPRGFNETFLGEVNADVLHIRNSEGDSGADTEPYLTE